MKVVVVLSVLFACGVAVPKVPTNFYTKMYVEYWNASMLTFRSNGGYMAQNYDRNMSIMCMNYTDGETSQLHTLCYLYMTSMRTNSSGIIYVYYEKLANGTMLACDQTSLEGVDFYGMFDWLVNSTQAGKCNDTCYQELEQWEYKLGNDTTVSIGVTDKDPNTPVFYKYAVNITDSEPLRYISCFTGFEKGAPPLTLFDIPSNCQHASRNAQLQDPWMIKHKMADHMQHQTKPTGRIRPQL